MGVIDGIEAEARTIATDGPESDGTLEWTDTTIVLARVHARGEAGLGYTYADASAAGLIEGKLGPVLEGRDPMATAACWDAMHAALRNAGQAGAGRHGPVRRRPRAARPAGRGCSASPSRRASGQPARPSPIYASGGFCSWDPNRLHAWCASRAGAGAIKIKVGHEPGRDLERLAVARAAAPDAELMVDANGAYATVAEAAHWTEAFAEAGARWMEEPLSSDDLAGLHRVRERAPAGVAIAAGEYCWSALDARRLLEAGAVDVLQLDVTRCGGLSGALMIDALAWAHGVPTSLHCAPAASVHAGVAMRSVVHLEHFHDHVRVEDEVFAAPPRPDGGLLTPPDRPGLGLEPR